MMIEIQEESKKLLEEIENSEDFQSIPFNITNIRAGDIIITNSTSSSGLTGHAGKPYILMQYYI